MTTTVADCLQSLRAQFSAAGLDDPTLEARFLLSGLMDCTTSALLLQKEVTLDQAFLAQLDLATKRRVAGEPLGRILGWREFWGLRFALSPATLEPRPDSETLIEATLAARPDTECPYRILDLGTGTGCLLAALLSVYPKATGVGVDISAEAVQTAMRNMAALGLGMRAQILRSAWTEALDSAAPLFDIIISNPPYIALDEMATLAPDVRTFDPTAALTDGADGLSAYRTLLQQIPQFLAENGLVVLELGQGQGPAVTALAAAQNLGVLALRPDYNGIDRALVLHRT